MRQAAVIRAQELRDILAGIDERVYDARAFGVNPRRESVYVCFRMIIAYKMRQDGYTLHAIGDALEQDHATVHNAARHMEYILSSAYHTDDWIRELWGAFVDAIGESATSMDGEVDRKTVSSAISQVYECGYLSQRGLNMLTAILGL